MANWKKEYLDVLKEEKRLFERDFGIRLDESFDPMRWVRSFFIEKQPELRWSNLNDFENCDSLDIWLLVYSETDENKDYAFRIKYRNINGMYFPSEYEHSCDDTFSWGTYGERLHCKHFYKALLFIDEELTSSYGNVAKSTFIPNANFLNEAYEVVYSSERSSERLKLLFDLMKNKLSLNEGFKLKILNKRLKYIKKV